MVTVVQLVEHQVVILGVAGSSPVSHPEYTPGQALRLVGGFLFSLPRTTALRRPAPLHLWPGFGD
jgi:hypothetical protein